MRHIFRTGLILVAGALMFVVIPSASAQIIEKCTVAGRDGQCAKTCAVADNWLPSSECVNPGEKCCLPAIRTSCTGSVGGKGLVLGICINEDEPCTGKTEATQSSCPQDWTCCGSYEAPAGGSAGSSAVLTNPLGAGATLYTLIRRVIQAFLGVVGSLALLVFVYAGVLWMTAGSSDRVQKAKDAMKYAVIGIAIIGFSYAISVFVIDALTGKIQSPVPVQEYALPSEPNP